MLIYSSYYKLTAAPDHYLNLTVSESNPTVSDSNPTFSAVQNTANTATKTATATATVSHNSHWGDVQLGLSGVDNVSDKLINAVVITATDGSNTTVTGGLVHLYNIWSATELAWKTTDSSLKDKNISKITYYCSDKDDSVGADNNSVPAYKNYIYEYTVNAPTKKVTASFENTDKTITLSDLPTESESLTASVYHTSGRGASAVTTYLAKDVSVSNNKITFTGTPIPGTTYTVEIKDTNYTIITSADYKNGENLYILMNIPYGEFYKTVGANNDGTIDAVSSATNKVGNYGKSGGAFHSGTTASTGNGTVTAVGGEKGATNQGVIWPVKVTGGQSVLSTLVSKRGIEITDSRHVTTATVGRGQTSASYLVGYETLTEAPAYSYYVLAGEPSNYLSLELKNNALTFSAGKSAATTKAGTVTASYGTNWGDVQLKAGDVSGLSEKLINAVTITTQNSVSKGLVHLYNVWSAADLAWKADKIPGLDGQTITKITYYCSDKDDSVGADNNSAPTYKNYIYEYAVSDLKIPPVYTGTITASFSGSSAITLTGLPEDAENLKATVYHNAGGRPAVLTYLTPLAVDSADQDIDPVPAAVKDGRITLTPGTVTNDKGESKSYGTPVSGTEYTVELSADNYILNKLSATYTTTSGGGSSRPSGGSTTTTPSTPTTSTITDPSTGTVTEVTRSETGAVTAVETTISDSAAAQAREAGSAVMLQTEVRAASNRSDAASVTLSAPVGAGSVKVEIPVSNISNTTVAVLVKADGSEEIVKASAVTDKGLVLGVSGNITVKIVDNRKEFQDVSGHWGQDAIAFASARELFNGTGGNTFSPEGKMTRAMLMVVLARFDGADTTVSQGNWYDAGMAWAKSQGISDGSSPNSNITREQLAVMLYRYAGSPAASGSASGFTDAGQISAYAQDAMAWACGTGLLQGSGGGQLTPQGDASRAELATILMRFCQQQIG